MEIKLPEYVEGILNTLNNNNYCAYVVGGCVRDCIMGIEPHDWDITTDATPEEVEKLFAISYPTGKKYGTITVGWINEQLGDEYHCEVTTFRVDGNYSDGRRPDSVTFGKDIIEDLSRRDFTINAMAYNSIVGLIDQYDGKNDIQNKIIRCVEDPKERFNEDALRILRAIRFACKFNFEIDELTLDAIRDKYNLIFNNISKERINDELIKILKYASKENKDIFSFTNFLWKKLFGLPISGCTEIYNTSLNVNQKLYSIFLFCNYSLADIEIWLRKYKFSNKDVIQIINLVKIYNKHLANTHVNIINTTNYIVRCMMKDFSIEDLNLFYNVCNKFKNFKEAFNREKNMPCKIEHLDINGNDIQREFNIQEGKAIGIILNKCLDAVIKNPILNMKEELIKFIKTNLNLVELKS
ncbi:CCA tRNA nucleotidyltransferase [uncultured Clostridium sp.]|uniref:CCA tRNA nucleotidyltransferase n=1 Tax=uncultured Clostridium sp. TaxID=59620 RepID=UPI002617B861|nr:CCA tRNA nucleotidyltransferase [uncultured Clostridium sp.]